MAAVEFAVSLPLIAALMVVLVEAGRALTQANAIEKGLRAGVMYVARADDPLSTESATAVSNLVKRGTVDATAPVLIDGWNDAGASVNVSLVSNFDTYGVTVPVYRVTATVPFSPMFPVLPAFNFTLSHQQAYVGQ